MSTAPIETLEMKALEQRAKLHRTASDLRERVKETRDKLRFSKHARKHLIPVSILASAIGFIAGYGFGGVFTRQ
jgi:hypothetical protein